MKYIAALLVALLALPVQADETFKQVFDCMRANVPPTIRIQDIEITTTDSSKGSRTIQGRLFATQEKGLLRMTLRVSDPNDLSGTAYLLREAPAGREDDMYLALPRVDRVRHITGKYASESLLATDFSYADVKQIQNAFTGGEGELEAPAQVDTHPVYVVALKPLKTKDSPYSLIRAWVDQKSCVALKVDFYVSDKLSKELTAPASSLTQSGKYWYVTDLQMEDLVTHGKTVMKLGKVESGTQLAGYYFNPNTFYLASH